MKRIRVRSSRRPADYSSARRARRSFRPLLEQLEGRHMLSGYFDEIADEVSGPSGAMSKVTTGLRALSSFASLPLLNKPLGQVPQLTDSLASFQSSLDTALR